MERYINHSSSSCDSLEHRIETYCRSELIIRFVLILSFPHRTLRKTKTGESYASGPHMDTSHGAMYRSSWHPAFSIWFQLHVQLKSALRQTKPREESGTRCDLDSSLKIISYSEMKRHRAKAVYISPMHTMVQATKLKNIRLHRNKCCKITNNSQFKKKLKNWLL